MQNGRTVRVSAHGFGAALIGNLSPAVDDDTALGAVDAAWTPGSATSTPRPTTGSACRSGGSARRWPPAPRRLHAVHQGRPAAGAPSPAGRPAATGGFDVPADVRRVWDFSPTGSAEPGGEPGAARPRPVDIVLIHDPDDHWEQAIARRTRRCRTARPGRDRRRRRRDEPVADAARFVRETDVDVVMLAGRYTLLDQTRASSCCRSVRSGVSRSSPPGCSTAACSPPTTRPPRTTTPPCRAAARPGPPHRPDLRPPRRVLPQAAWPSRRAIRRSPRSSSAPARRRGHRQRRPDGPARPRGPLGRTGGGGPDPGLSGPARRGSPERAGPLGKRPAGSRMVARSLVSPAGPDAQTAGGQWPPNQPGTSSRKTSDGVTAEVGLQRAQPVLAERSAQPARRSSKMRADRTRESACSVSRTILRRASTGRSRAPRSRGAPACRPSCPPPVWRPRADGRARRRWCRRGRSPGRRSRASAACPDVPGGRARRGARR